MISKSYTIESDVGIIPEIVDEILKSIRSEYSLIQDECIFRIKVALNEIITNAIIHGNNGIRKKRVIIKYIFKDNGMEFYITDEGKKFIPKSEDKQDLLQENNRGLLICKNFCDDLEFCYTEGVGNTIKIVICNNNSQKP